MIKATTAPYFSSTRVSFSSQVRARVDANGVLREVDEWDELDHDLETFEAGSTPYTPQVEDDPPNTADSFSAQLPSDSLSPTTVPFIPATSYLTAKTIHPRKIEALARADSPDSIPTADLENSPARTRIRPTVTHFRLPPSGGDIVGLDGPHDDDEEPIGYAISEEGYHFPRYHANTNPVLVAAYPEIPWPDSSSMSEWPEDAGEQPSASPVRGALDRALVGIDGVLRGTIKAAIDDAVRQSVRESLGLKQKHTVTEAVPVPCPIGEVISAGCESCLPVFMERCNAAGQSGATAVAKDISQTVPEGVKSSKHTSSADTSSSTDTSLTEPHRPVNNVQTLFRNQVQQHWKAVATGTLTPSTITLMAARSSPSMAVSSTFHDLPAGLQSIAVFLKAHGDEFQPPPTRIVSSLHRRSMTLDPTLQSQSRETAFLDLVDEWGLVLWQYDLCITPDDEKQFRGCVYLAYLETGMAMSHQEWEGMLACPILEVISTVYKYITKDALPVSLKSEQTEDIDETVGSLKTPPEEPAHTMPPSESASTVTPSESCSRANTMSPIPMVPSDSGLSRTTLAVAGLREQVG